MNSTPPTNAPIIGGISVGVLGGLLVLGGLAFYFLRRPRRPAPGRYSSMLAKQLVDNPKSNSGWVEGESQEGTTLRRPGDYYIQNPLQKLKGFSKGANEVSNLVCTEFTLYIPQISTI